MSNSKPVSRRLTTDFGLFVQEKKSKRTLYWLVDKHKWSKTKYLIHIFMLLFWILEWRYSQCNHYLSNRFDVAVAFWAFKGNSDILHKRCVVLIVLFVSGATNRLNNKWSPIICHMLSLILCLVRLFIVFGDKLSRSPSELRKIVRIDIFCAVCPWLIPRRWRMSHAPRSQGASRYSTRFMVSRIWSGRPGLWKLGVGRRAVVVTCCYRFIWESPKW